MSFREDISSLIQCSNSDETNSINKDTLPNKVTINLNVFGAFMKHIIMGNLNSTAVVTKDISWG